VTCASSPIGQGFETRERESNIPNKDAGYVLHYARRLAAICPRDVSISQETRI
jgi:hypothetical protein